MTKTTLFRLSALHAAIVLMTACGGGGGGGGGGNESSGTVTSAGTAGKGIIIGGSVEALEVAGGALVSRGTATTDTDGNYTLAVSGYTGGPMVIRIAGGDGVTMKCDVQAGCGEADFGDSVDLPDTFVMRTLLPSAPDGAALSRCITPFTELATSRAQELAGGNLAAVTAETAANALSEVGNLVGGLDVLRTCVVDLTDPAKVADADPAQLALSGLAAAVLAVDSAGDPSTAIAGLNSTFTGGTVTVASLQSLVDAASTELLAVSADAIAASVYTVIQDDIDGAEGETLDPEPSDTAAQPAIAQGKALIDEVRSLVLNLAQDAETGESNTAVIAFANELDAAGAAVDAAPIGDAFNLAIDAASEFYATVADGQVNQTMMLNTTSSGGGAQTATITVSKPSNGNHSVTVAGTVTDFTTNLAVDAPGNPLSGGTTPTNLAGSVTGSMQSASGNGLRATLEGDVAVTALTYDEITERAALESATFSGTATMEQIGVADPFRFVGAIALDMLACTECPDQVVDGDVINDDPAVNIDLFTLDGTFGNGDAAFEALVGIDIDSDSATSFDPRLDISAENVLAGAITVQLDAGLENFHDYGVTLVASLDDIRTLNGGVDGELQDVDATINVTLRRDGNTIAVAAVAQPPAEGINVVDVSIENQDGVALRFDNLLLGDSVSGTVFVGETAVGTVEETEGGVILIRWADGSFESLG